MLEFTRLKNNLKRNSDGFPGVRLAVLCDYSSQHLLTAVKGYGMEKGLAFTCYEADYDQIEQQVFDAASALYSFLPEVVLLSKSSYKLLDEFYATPPADRSSFAQRHLAQWQTVVATLRQRTAATVVLTNFPELDDAVFGSYANNVVASFLYQVRKLNLLLMEEAQTQKGLLVADAQGLTANAGLVNAVDQKNLVKADMVWSLSFLPVLAKTIVRQIEAAKGRIKKCLVLDLDNTLWGGVVGDDGLEGIQLGDFGVGKAFSRFQKWIKELRRRGVLVCVCSKNDAAVAKEVFEKHPDSVLRLDDIAVFAANWNNKVDNLHYIKNTLNIGFDAMVFVDDNPFERGMVKEAVPELEVPEMPDDPVEYLPYLQRLNLFETASFTTEDGQRTALYQREAERAAYQAVYKNERDYLESLQMTAETKPLDAFTLPRAAQLSQRSNQFNLRTVRYSETELTALASSPNAFPFVVSLSDKFGDYGIISFVVIRQTAKVMFIENWMMSCRVLKRGVEEAVLNQIMAIAKKTGCETVVGEYIPTAKNALVKDHYRILGFEPHNGQWRLPVHGFEEKRTAIKTAPAVSKSLSA